MRKFLGGLAFGVGILASGTSGLCLLLSVGSLATSTDSLEKEIAQAVLVISLVVLAAGVGLFFLGRHLLKSASEE